MTFKGVTDIDKFISSVRSLLGHNRWDRVMLGSTMYIHMAVMTMGVGRKIDSQLNSLLWWTINRKLPEGVIVPVMSMEEVNMRCIPHQDPAAITNYTPLQYRTCAPRV